GGPAEPDQSGPSHPDEGQAQLDGDGRLRERLRERDAVALDGLLLRSSPDNADVRELAGEPFEELALPALCLEEREHPVRQRDRQGQPWASSSRSDVDHTARQRVYERGRAQSVLEQDASGLAHVLERRRSGCLKNGLEPAAEQIFVQVRWRDGAATRR